MDAINHTQNYIIIPSQKKVGYYGIYQMTGQGVGKEIYTSNISGLSGAKECREQVGAIVDRTV